MLLSHYPSKDVVSIASSMGRNGDLIIYAFSIFRKYWCEIYQMIDYLDPFVRFELAIQIATGLFGQCHHFVGCAIANQWFGKPHHLLSGYVGHRKFIRQLVQFLGSNHKRVGALVNKRLFSNLRFDDARGE